MTRPGGQLGIKISAFEYKQVREGNQRLRQSKSGNQKSRGERSFSEQSQEIKKSKGWRIPQSGVVIRS